MRTMTSSISTRSSGAAIRAGLCALALWAAPAPALAQAAGAADLAAARAVIATTAEDVVKILQGPGETKAKRRMLEAIAQERFDFRTMSRLVLRQQWRHLDAAKQDEFVREFTDYLANDYGRRLERYDNETVEVSSALPMGKRGDVVVQTVIRGGANEGAVVDYRMKRNADDQWKIINVVVEGISLVHNFADQFREVISRGGAEALLKQLREKNAAAAEA